MEILKFSDTNPLNGLPDKARDTLNAAESSMPSDVVMFCRWMFPEVYEIRDKEKGALSFRGDKNRRTISIPDVLVIVLDKTAKQESGKHLIMAQETLENNAYHATPISIDISVAMAALMNINPVYVFLANIFRKMDAFRKGGYFNHGMADAMLSREIVVERLKTTSVTNEASAGDAHSTKTISAHYFRVTASVYTKEPPYGLNAPLLIQ